MSWMAVNNAPLLGTGPTDISGLADQFRDGQKLRQEHEARQQQKALNEISRESDFEVRLGKARAHKYAGALVPLIQQQEQDRLIAEQKYNQGQADINKTNAEVGKIGAEQGEIGAKTTGLVRENTAGIQNDISALAVTQNPKLFALGIGEMVKQELINPERADMMLKMVATDQPNAAAVLQAMVMANPELAKLFQPKTEVVDTGDAKTLHTVDPFTGQYSEPYRKLTLGESPDNYGTRTSGERNNIRTTNASIENTQYTVDAGERNNIRTTDATNHSTDVRAKTASEAQAIDWFEKTEKAKDNEFKRENPQANRKQIPPSAMKTMGELQDKLASNATTMTENLKWMKRLNSGELQLGAMKNFGNTAAARTGITSLGENPEAYAEFNAYLKDLANKALRLNAGVQTDMDYKRQLEAIVAGTSIPKDNGIAFGLLNRIHRDFDSQNRAIYKTASDYDKEYRGVTRPTYDQLGKKTGSGTNKQPAKETAGQSIIGSTLGGR